ncbi:MAG: DUF4446 family protein [Anaerolineales bacterium]
MEGVLLPWVIAETILLFVAAYWIYTLEKRQKNLEMRYKNLLALTEESEEQSVISLSQRVDEQGTQLRQMGGGVRRLEKIMPHTIQGHSIVRYQAFSNVGGDQSFSLALVDAVGNGLLLSCLHGHDMRVYGKPVKQWRSVHSLSAEEQQVLGEARQMVESS